MIILWIIALIATNALAVDITIYAKNVKHRANLELEKSIIEHATWNLAFDAGWNAAISDPGTIRSNYRKMFVEPYDK